MSRLLERLGLHRRELRAWAMYDWANSAFYTTVVAAIFPDFFASVAAADLPPVVATQRYAAATTIGVAVAAVLGPVLGAVADRAGIKKRLLAVFTAIGVAATASMALIAAALREVAAMSVFTTHTPVEAGHDRFRADLAGPHLEALARGLGLPLDEVLALGSERPGDAEAPFCPTVLALKLTRRTNAVSALHGRVSRQMWQPLYPGKTEEVVPIGHITNGVHVRTWLAADMHNLLLRYLGPRWLDRLSFPDLWTKIDRIPDAELWEIHQVLKARLLAFARGRLADRRQRLGLPAPQKEPLDPDALTLGFARRFATYKRADLLFQDLDRFAKLAGNAERPLQILYAGKAHPRDTGGKALAQRVANLEKDPRFAGRVVFIEDYSMHVGRQLVQGVDVWLNTPRRPLEACGTSGQKGILNGVLNCSILDGWWAEAYDGSNGFAIGGGEIHADPELQDERDALSLFETLEREVIPLYYERNAQGIPTGWIGRVKRAIRTLAWRYNADRMVMDYVKECYLPAAGGVTSKM